MAMRLKNTPEARQRIVETAKALLDALTAIGRGDGSHADEVREIIEFYDVPHE